MTDVLVRPGSVHGQSLATYAETLRDRLDDVEVVAPGTAAAERKALPEATVVTGPDFDGDRLGIAESLAYFACVYAGTDHLPLGEFRDRDVAVTNAADVVAPNVRTVLEGGDRDELENSVV